MVNLDSNKSTELFDLGGDGDLLASLLPQGTGQIFRGRNDSLVVMPHASGPAEVTSVGAPHHGYTGKGSCYHSKAKQKHSAHFCAYCNPFKSLYPSSVLASLQARAVRAQEQRAQFYLMQVLPDAAEGALASNDNL